jgi:hypothetical protein
LDTISTSVVDPSAGAALLMVAEHVGVGAVGGGTTAAAVVRTGTGTGAAAAVVWTGMMGAAVVWATAGDGEAGGATGLTGEGDEGGFRGLGLREGVTSWVGEDAAEVDPFGL